MLPQIFSDGAEITTRFDLFIDLSGSDLNSSEADHHLHLLQAQTLRNFGSPRVYVVRPEPSFQEVVEHPYGGVELLRRAIKDSASRRRGLVVIVGAWRPNNECLGALADVALIDPMIASVQPRFEEPDGVISLPGGAEKVLPLGALQSMPRTTLAPELLSALFVLTPRALLAAPTLFSSSLDHAFLELLIGLRRRGFRNVLCNRIAVPFPLNPALAYPRVEFGCQRSDSAWQRDVALGLHWLSSMPERKLEALLSGAFSPTGRRRLLLDCRGVSALHNGTAQAVIGFLHGFSQLNQTTFDIVVLATRDGADFHDIITRFPCFEIQFDHPQGTFFAAVLLSQPWSSSTIIELHRSSLIIVFNILDTIAWDVMYPVSEELGNVWKVIGQIADGLLFNSKFSLQRYNFRFTPIKSIRQKVTYHSFSAEEIIPKTTTVVSRKIKKPFLLLIGNKYDHKEVTPTLEILVQAFPCTRIVVLGINNFPSPLVSTYESGAIDGNDIHALMGNATVIIFPSHYEGFGLPVVEGLAHGTRVIVRDSPLWQEIAGLSQRPELIVPFEDEIELVDAVSSALKGISPETPKRASQGQRILTWSDCAQNILDLIEEIDREVDGSRWLGRDAILRMDSLEAIQQQFNPVPVNTPPISTSPANAPPTDAPPTNAPPANAPPANAPPTNVPPANAPPANAPPANAPPANAPPINDPLTNASPTNAPPPNVNDLEKTILDRAIKYYILVQSLKYVLTLFSRRRRNKYKHREKVARRLADQVKDT